MPYTYFRYIAYQVPTVAKIESGGLIYGIDPGRLGLPKLKGDVGNLGTDAPIRIRRLIKVMIEAKRKIKSGDNNSTLKIFMAPEFYFRPDNDDVSYTYKQFKAIRDVIQQTISEEKMFYDWLVVPGTIMWRQDQDTAKRQIDTTKGKSVYFNSAIYIQTADSSGHTLFGGKLKAEPSQRIEKAKASEVDGIPTGRHGGKYTDDSSKVEASVMFPKYLTDPKKDKHVFESGGIRFGLDICLEHGSMKITKSVIIDDKTKKKYVQLHLLIAAGMPIIKESVAAVKGGYILRTDGCVGDYWTNSKKVEKYRVSGKLIKDDCDADVSTPKSWARLPMNSVDHMKIDIGETHPLYISNPVGCDKDFWSKRPQQINIYDRCPIPSR